MNALAAAQLRPAVETNCLQSITDRNGGLDDETPVDTIARIEVDD
jgi:hypothetical protein